MKLATLRPLVAALDPAPLAPKSPPPDQQATYGRGRGGRPWRRLRASILERDKHLCQPCLRAGIWRQADEVDHVVPVVMGGDDAATNLQSICCDCHAAKSRGEANAAKVSMTPAWLPVSAKPLELVCGPPGSGKSTHVRSHSAPSDLVLDLDDLARVVTGRQLWELERAQRNSLIRQRNDMVAAYMRAETAHPKCWVVAVAGDIRSRDFWRSRGAVVTVIRTRKAECLARIDARGLPPAVRGQQRCAVDEWQ